jgi:hypothetical protein
MMRNFISFFVCSFLFLLALPACVGSDGGGGEPGPKEPGLEFIGANTALKNIMTKDHNVIIFNVENKSAKDAQITKIELSGATEPKFELLARTVSSDENCQEGQLLAVGQKCPIKLRVSAERAGIFDVNLQIKINYLLKPEDEQRTATTNLTGSFEWKTANVRPGGKVEIGEMNTQQLSDGSTEWSVWLTNNSDQPAKFGLNWLTPDKTGTLTYSRDNFTCRNGDPNDSFELEPGRSCAIAYILEDDAKIKGLKLIYKIGTQVVPGAKTF